MDVKWRTVATCDDCGIRMDNIEPEVIVGTQGLDMYWVVCPCCLKMRKVDGVQENLKKIVNDKKGILVQPNMAGEKLYSYLYVLSKEKKNAFATNIINTIKKQRAQMGLDPLQLK